jgi:hypothetical protein
MIIMENNFLSGFQKLWVKDKISFFSFLISIGSLILMVIIMTIDLIQSFNPTHLYDFSQTLNTIATMFILAIPAIFGMVILQYRLSSKTTRIENEISDLNKSTKKTTSKIVSEIQEKKHKIFYYLDGDTIEQLFSQIKGGVNPTSLELKESGKTNTGFNAGLSHGAQFGAHADCEEGREQKITYEISPNIVNRFVEVQTSLFDNDEVTFDLAEVEDHTNIDINMELGSDYTQTERMWNERKIPEINYNKFYNLSFNETFNTKYKFKLLEEIHPLIKNDNIEKQILDYVSGSLENTISSTLTGISKQEIIKRTLERFERCKTFVVLNEDFTVNVTNPEQIVLEYDHKINKYIEKSAPIKILIICEDKYFAKSQKNVIQQTGNKIKCVCLAFCNRWDSKNNTLTLIPIALYK